ncbi:MAG: bifunctional tetrahydrofolate synthase/dihydrofolate synthase [Gammaproteobacteria bacterium]
MRFSRLDDWLSWLETLHPQAIDLGLDRVRQVAQRLGLLQPGVPVVTVAGTNGKGSVTALLEALLRAHGRRTGLYTSPHIRRFNERIRIDGREAADDDIVRALAAVDAARGEVSLTYFEFTTLAAFLLFREAGLDAWVLEIGLGGRLDAVNVIDPDVAVLTSVGLDHGDWLGHTREDVGREKAGIFRAGRPAVIGDAEPPDSVRAAVRNLEARALWVGEDFAVSALANACWSWRGIGAHGAALLLEGLPCPPLALANAATALQALACLPQPIDPSAVRRALASVTLAGRNQRIDRGGRPVIIDVGHNADALHFLRRELPRQGLGERFHVVLGMLADKDIEAAVRVLEPLAEAWHIAPLPTPRTADAGRVSAAITACSACRPCVYPDIGSALLAALGAPDSLPVLVVGSFYTVAAALSVLEPVTKNLA